MNIDDSDMGRAPRRVRLFMFLLAPVQFLVLVALSLMRVWIRLTWRISGMNVGLRVGIEVSFSPRDAHQADESDTTTTTRE